MAFDPDEANKTMALVRLLCELPIMVGAGYITQEEADTLRPIILAALRLKLDL